MAISGNAEELVEKIRKMFPLIGLEITLNLASDIASSGKRKQLKDERTIQCGMSSFLRGVVSAEKNGMHAG